MGESSTPRRPTHDTNTSRRQVNTHTHTRQQQQQQHFIKAKQIQTHHEVYWIDCIYDDASSCYGYGFDSFCKVDCISRTSELLPSHQCEMRGMPVQCNGGGNLQSERGRHGLRFIAWTT